jgi:hypothetical protein
MMFGLVLLFLILLASFAIDIILGSKGSSVFGEVVKFRRHGVFVCGSSQQQGSVKPQGGRGTQQFVTTYLSIDPSRDQITRGATQLNIAQRVLRPPLT